MNIYPQTIEIALFYVLKFFLNDFTWISLQLASKPNTTFVRYSHTDSLLSTSHMCSCIYLLTDI